MTQATVLHEVNNELTKADSVDDLCRRAVELGRERLGFDRVGIWFLAEDGQSVQGSFGTDENGNIRDERDWRLPTGPAGKSMLTSRKPMEAVKEEYAEISNDKGEIVGTGAAARVPIWDGQRNIGFLATDNLLQHRPITDHDCELLTLYASTLGHLCVRKRAEEAERLFAARLTALHEVNNELTRADSVDELCRRAIELGRSRLGFDRLGIWFISEDEQHVVGSFGTDERGRTRDERGQRSPMDVQARNILTRRQETGVIRDEDVGLRDDKGQIIGTGTHAWIPIWDGEKHIGFLDADNLLRHEPITDRDCELLVLYASALGHFCARKRAYKALRAESDKLKSIFEAMDDGVYIVNQNHDIEYVNPVLVADFGPHEGRKCYAYFHDREEVCPWCKNQDVFAGKTVRWEWYSSKNGKTYDLVDTPLRNADGTISKLEIFRDITDRKRDEEALRAHARERETILQASLDGLLVLDLQGQVLEVNPAYCDIVGYAQDELRGMSLTDLEGQEAPEDTAAHIEAIIESGSDRFETRHRCKDGRIVDLEVGSHFVDQGDHKFFVSFIRDVTQRKRAEGALRESEERLRRVIESLPVVLYSVEGGTNRTLLMMGAVREVLGYEAEDLLEDIDIANRSIHPDDRDYVSRTFKDGLASGKPFEVEYRFIHGIDGHPVWLHEYAVPVVGPDGSILRQDGVVVDITEQKHAEQEREQIQAQLLQAQKLESLGVLAGGIAHDFNNLLTVISGNAEFLRKTVSLDPAQAGTVKDIEAAAMHAAEMTRSLQAFSRPGKPRIRQTDANLLVNEVYRLLRRMIPATLDFQLDLDPSPCTIAVDPGQMQQVLVNLCVNARDAMPTGGLIQIQTRHVDRESLPPRARKDAFDDQYVRIRVSDNGCGMNAETLHHVFDPFFTTKSMDRGTGLGLAIVYKIVEAHNGAIDVASQPGQGTHFDVFFPAVEACAPDDSEDQILSARGQERILVVDDEEMVGRLLQTVLESRGYQVTLTHRPQDALEAARAADPPFDLAIIDYALPGMTGDHFLAELRRTHPELKAILVSGYGLDEDEASVSEVDYEILRKPFSVSSIVHIARDVLDRR